jgi:hypothetical protein
LKGRTIYRNRRNKQCIQGNLMKTKVVLPASDPRAGPLLPHVHCQLRFFRYFSLCGPRAANMRTDTGTNSKSYDLFLISEVLTVSFLQIKGSEAFYRSIELAVLSVFPMPKKHT